MAKIISKVRVALVVQPITNLHALLCHSCILWKPTQGRVLYLTDGSQLGPGEIKRLYGFANPPSDHAKEERYIYAIYSRYQ